MQMSSLSRTMVTERVGWLAGTRIHDTWLLGAGPVKLARL